MSISNTHEVKMLRVRCSGNRALTNGGCISAKNSPRVEIEASSFSDNTAVNAGGSIYVTSGMGLTISSTVIEDSNADAGGAVAIGIHSTLKLLGGNRLSNNTAVNGGGISLCEYTSTVLVTGGGNTFKYNVAQYGAVFQGKGFVNIEGSCTIVTDIAVKE